MTALLLPFAYQLQGPNLKNVSFFSLLALSY